MTSPRDRRAVLDALLSQALERPPAERRAFLVQVCGDDGELRRELERLLAAAETVDSPLSPGGALAGALGQEVAKRLADERDVYPERIGAYRLLEPIGEGGMGVVYVAEQSEPVRRKVALKLIKAGMDTREVIARFHSERQALALMNHPNIARILEAGATAGGRPYFVMEYVPGLPLVEYCDRQRLDVRRRLRLFVDVCEAVQHAHQKGVVHRDIKSSNVLVQEEDGRPIAKVIDFGVAKAVGQRLGDLTVHTRLGGFLGTPDYVSPEQVRTSGLDVDTRADVYSLGAVLYELLTGARVFDFSDPALSLAEIQAAIFDQDPQPPSVRVAGGDAAAEETEHGDARTLAILARAYHRTGAPARAVVTLRQAIDASPEGSTLRADLERRLARYAEADPSDY